jgi:aminotransferase EvaB
VLRERLGRLDEQNRQRRAIAARYNHAFRELSLQCPAAGEDYVAHLYVVRCERRDALRTHLAARGIGAEVHYPVPDHHQPVVRERWADVVLPVTEAAIGTILTLPCFPAMTEEQSSAVERAVLDFYA